MCILFHERKIMDCNTLILNYIRYNVHHYVIVNIFRLNYLRGLPGIGGASFYLYLYPPPPPPINDPYKGTMPRVSKKKFGENLGNVTGRPIHLTREQ